MPQGRVSKVVVQATDEIYEQNVTSTYRRTYIQNIAPMYMRLANWPCTLPFVNTADGAYADFVQSITSTTAGLENLPAKVRSLITILISRSSFEDYPMLCLKWFVASCIIALVVSKPILFTHSLHPEVHEHERRGVCQLV